MTDRKIVSESNKHEDAKAKYGFNFQSASRKKKQHPAKTDASNTYFRFFFVSFMLFWVFWSHFNTIYGHLLDNFNDTWYTTKKNDVALSELQETEIKKNLLFLSLQWTYLKFARARHRTFWIEQIQSTCCPLNLSRDKTK